MLPWLLPQTLAWAGSKLTLSDLRFTKLDLYHILVIPAYRFRACRRDKLGAVSGHRLGRGIGAGCEKYWLLPSLL